MIEVAFTVVFLLVVLALGWALFYTPPSDWLHDHPIDDPSAPAAEPVTEEPR